jgi:hypothetical protein
MGLAETLLRCLEHEPQRVFTLEDLCRAIGPHDWLTGLPVGAACQQQPRRTAHIVGRTLAALERVGVVSAPARNTYRLAGTAAPPHSGRSLLASR